MARRDAEVVRQQRDYSCGLAALATLLRFDGVHLDENELLEQLLEGRPGRRVDDGGVSLADLAWLAAQQGFPARGYYLDSAALRNLRQPVIVALEVNGRAHFSVLRSVSDDGVAHLADPSWGNHRVAAWEFSTMFSTENSTPGPDSSEAVAKAAPGRALIVLGRDGGPLGAASKPLGDIPPVQRMAPAWLAPRERGPGDF